MNTDPEPIPSADSMAETARNVNTLAAETVGTAREALAQLLAAVLEPEFCGQIPEALQVITAGGPLAFDFKVDETPAGVALLQEELNAAMVRIRGVNDLSARVLQAAGKLMLARQNSAE